MAIGLIPHYSVAFPAEGLTTEQFLGLAARAAKNLNWELSDSGSDGFIAYTPFRKRSVNEKIHLHVDSGLVTLKSESTGGEFVDWGRNKRNIDAFILNYDDLRSSLTPGELNALSGEPAHNRVLNESGEFPNERSVDAGADRWDGRIFYYISETGKAGTRIIGSNGVSLIPVFHCGNPDELFYH